MSFHNPHTHRIHIESELQQYNICVPTQGIPPVDTLSAAIGPQNKTVSMFECCTDTGE